MMKLILLGGWILLLSTPSFASTFSDSQINQFAKEAQTFEQQKQYQEAILIWEKLSNHAKASNDWPSYLEYSLNYGVSLQKMRKFAEAAKYLDGIKKQASKKVATDNEHLLMLYHKLGVSYHYLKDYSKAASYYTLALKQRERNPTKYRLDLIKGYYALGYVQYTMNRYDAALENLNYSIGLQRDPPTKELYRTYRIIARTYREIGDYDQAKYYYDLLEQYYIKKYGDNPVILADFSVDLANFYNELKKNEEAINYAKNAVIKYNSLPTLRKIDSIGVANAYSNLGNAYRLSEKYYAALEAFQQSLRLNLKTNGKKHPATAGNYNIMGLVYLHKGDYLEAEKMLNEALQIKLDLDNRVYLGSTLNNFGDLWTARGNYQKAAKSYHESVCYSAPFCESFDYQQPLTDKELIGGDRRLIVLSLAAKAKALHALYKETKEEENLLLSFQTIQLACEVIDQIRLSYQTDHSKGFLTEKAKDIYEEAIAVSLKLYQLKKERKYYEAAFAFSEKSKSIILLEAVLKSNEKLFTGVSKELQQREHQIKVDRSVCEKQLAKAKEKNKEEEVNRLTKELFQHNRAYQLLLDSIKQGFPEYFNLLLNAGTISLRDIQRKVLSPGQALVEYFIGEESIYVFLIKQDDFFVKELPLDFSLSDWIQSMRQGVFACHDAHRLIPNEEKRLCQQQYADKGYQLFSKLLHPLEEVGLPEQLLIIPDGVLTYLPFDAMLDSPVQQLGDYVNYPYLLKKHQVSYAYSATLLQELKQGKRRKAKKEILAVAPSFQGLLSANQRSFLAPLQFNEQEVNKIQRIFGGLILKGGEALKQTFLQLAPNYQILHLSSHATTSNTTDNEDSYIAFTHQQVEPNPEQLLYLWELYNLKINADMVVLSACETGLGEVLQGEGVMSLARAFSYAGANSVITTLWQVNDQLSADLMTQFYSNLKNGASKDFALSKAKQSFLTNAQKADPYYWAGFVPIGNMEPLKTNRGFTLTHFIILLSVLFGSIILLRGRKI